MRKILEVRGGAIGTSAPDRAPRRILGTPPRASRSVRHLRWAYEGGGVRVLKDADVTAQRIQIVFQTGNSHGLTKAR